MSDDIDPDLVMSQTGLSEYFRVSKTVVNNWAARQAINGFPDPEPTLLVLGERQGRRAVRVWNVAKVAEWRETYRPRRGPRDLSSRARDRKGRLLADRSSSILD